MFLARRKPDYIARTDFLDGAALALNPSKSCGDNQGLPQRMGVPGGTGAGSKVTLAPVTLEGTMALRNSGSMRTVPENQSAGPVMEACEPFQVIIISYCSFRGMYRYLIIRITLAGTPATMAFAGTSLVTTAPAAIMALSPTVTPGTTVAWAPIQTFFPRTMGRG